jgi:long-subunit acyl-CoA synthetase (AMP-forming)
VASLSSSLRLRSLTATAMNFPIGEAGEMLVRGKHVMREYWNRP